MPAVDGQPGTRHVDPWMRCGIRDTSSIPCHTGWTPCGTTRKRVRRARAGGRAGVCQAQAHLRDPLIRYIRTPPGIPRWVPLHLACTVARPSWRGGSCPGTAGTDALEQHGPVASPNQGRGARRSPPISSATPPRASRRSFFPQLLQQPFPASPPRWQRRVDATRSEPRQASIHSILDPHPFTRPVRLP